MNAKQAYEILSGGTNDFKQTMDAIAVAAHALQKRIPKEMEKIDDYDQVRICPSCGNVTSFYGKEFFCHECGQKIKWI